MKKTFTTLLVLILAISMIACFAACSPSSAEKSADASETPASPEASEEASPDAEESAETGDSGYAIYTYEDAISLSGITAPHYEDRSSIEKALPTEVYTEPIKVGLTQNGSDMAWFVEVGDAVQAYCDEKGWELVHMIADYSAEKQQEQFDTFITLGCDVILLDPTDMAAGKELAIKAVEAGIPVIGIGQELAFDSPETTCIMSNSYMNAWNVGLVAAKQFEGKSIKAGALLGKIGSASSESRVNGMIGAIVYTRAIAAGENIAQEDAMLIGQHMIEDIRKTGKASSDYDFEILASNGDGQWTEVGGMTATEDLMTGSPEINLLLIDQDFMAIGAVNALEQMGITPGKDVQIISAADSYYVALELIQQGKILCTGYGPAYAIGTGAAELVNKIFYEGYDAQNMPTATCLEPIAISAENVDEYYDYPNTNFAKAKLPEYMSIEEYNAAHAK